MEENSDAHMETDVSSTTDDVLESPRVTGSHGDIEMVVVVEELKEEDDSSLDQASRRNTPTTSAEAAPQTQTSPQKTTKPANENDTYEQLSNNYSEPMKSKGSPISLKTSPEKKQPESSGSSKNADTTVSPGKSTERTNSCSIKSIEKIADKSPTKNIEREKTIERSPFKKYVTPFIFSKELSIRPFKRVWVQKNSDKPVNNDVGSSEKSGTDVQEKASKDVSMVKITNAEIKLPEQSVKTVTLTENVTDQEKESKTSPKKADNLEESSAKEIKIQEKPLAKDSESSAHMEVDPTESTNKESDLKKQSIAEEDKVKKSAAKVSSNDISQLETTGPNSETLDCDANITEEAKTINGDDKMDVSIAAQESLTDLNDSQHSMDPEPHNKSISRELKSLIKSAKESKIISECTQLTSKMRKSRSQVDSANTSLQLESEKIANRRSSNNSQISNSSEKSDVLKRSMRSQNPEFANKCKQFLNNLSSKEIKESDDAVSEDETNAAKKIDAQKNDSPTSPKKKKVSDQPVIDGKELRNKFRSDGYCWRCHWTVDQEENDKSHPPLHCTVCPRSFHYKCLTGNERKNSSEKNWVCPDCLSVLHAEGSDTRSPAMKKTSLGTLCDLLKYALERMMDLNGVEPFMQPVDRTAFPDYDKYVVHPMDLSQMKKNIAEGLYGSTEAFVADVQWILHNSIIFNTLQSKLTGGARALVRSCRAEMGEIEACPECYAAAHARRATWFTDVCTTPHMLLWAKLKGFPYWPAKGMSVNSSGLVDVRFFGAHDRAWVPAKDCFLFSEKDPNNFRSKRQDILDSMQEAEQHIRNISRKYGKFVYPPFKTQFDPSKLTEQLKMMIPSFEGEVVSPAKDKPVSASPLAKGKRRSNSKGSKSSANDGDGSETEDPSTSARTEAIKADKNTSEKGTEKSAKVDSPTVVSKPPPPVEETLVTRKRRRSNLEEARVMTVIASSSPIPEKKNKIDKPEEQEPSSSKDEKAHSTTKEVDTESNKKKSETQKTKSKDEEPSSTQDERESLRVTPIKLVALPRTNKQTPKMFAATKAPSNPGSPREEDKTPLKTKPKPDKATSEKTKEEKAKRHRSSKSNKSLNSTGTPKSSKTEKKPENEASAPKPKEKKKETDEANNSATESSNTESPQPMKDRIHFDDDTSLAVLARERRRSNANLPTISSVCSLSTIAQASLTTGTSTTTSGTDLTIQASSDSSIFTPTSTESVLNMKDAVNKLQKLRDNSEPVVGRVGVRAFARMTSPDRSGDNVEVEIKAEPVDLEEDEVRLSEKMDLMTACKLQPVNPAQSLRDVRISRVVGGPGAAKKAEPRPRARKTFPQPRPNEGRSELNGKNSMVYIPIQPPVTQPPVRAARPTAAALRLNAPAATGNNTVNTVITPLKPSTSLSTQSVVSVPSVGQVSVPTVGQVPTTVHTVPLMTSVNGHWMFSLQPVMSVGGVDNTTPSPMVNGTASPAIAVPLPPPAAGAPPARAAADTTPVELPRLQARPQDAAAAVAAPPSAGPLSTKIYQNAQKLSEMFRSLMEETIERAEEPAAAATALRLQLEQARWRHSQEIDELKHNHELTMAEMRLSFEKDKLRVVTEARRAAEVEFDAALKLAKSKQWCANCSQEAQFYCCWNTSYCDQPCQRAHWPLHFPTCAQKPKDGNGDESSTPKSRLQVQPDVLPALQKSSGAAPQPLTVGGKLARVFSPQDLANQKASIIVSMVEDNSGNQTMKCVGTYKPGSAQSQMPPLILNKQVVNDESGKKVVTSGGYLIVGATSTGSVLAPAPARRPNTIQYFT